jgi:hypothetical protein
VFADRADQPLLRAFVCTVQAKSAYGANRVAEFADRAEARLGHPDAAPEALHRVHAERDRVGDPADVGGLFACSVVGQACFAAGVHLTLDDPTAALAAADSAGNVHTQATATSGQPPYRSITMARINALTAQLRLGQFDGAQATLDRIIEGPAERRIQTFVQRLNRAATTLDSDRYRNGPAARALDNDTDDFRRANAVQTPPTARC